MFRYHYHYEKSETECIDRDIDVYTWNENWLVPSGNEKVKVIGRKKKARREKHWNRPMGFDIETTKYYDDGKEKRAMFVWQFAVDTEFCIMGRTWQEFVSLLKKLNEDGRVYHIFVHNLSYEAYFMLQILNDMLGELEIKLLKSLKVWEIRWENIIFHDSAVISMMSLEKTALDYNRVFFKAKGDFDYEKMFNILMPLTDKETGYCLCDVLSLCEYIDRLMDMYSNYTIFELPKTQTGFVRKEVLAMTREDRNYRKFFEKLRMTKEQYELCRKAFDGGFTGGSIEHYAQYIIGEDIRCRDITSSYPYQMVSKEYPINKWVSYEWDDIETWEKYLSLIETKCVIATYTFTGVNVNCTQPRFSISKADYIEEYEAYNGKLLNAKIFVRTMNEVAFMDFIKYYTFENICVDNIIVADKGKLPKPIIKANLKFFEAKSTLKNVDGKEVEYMKGKQCLNGIYGMSATDIVRDEWYIKLEDMLCGKDSPDVTEAINRYWDSENSFMAYQWACYVTAYARHQVYEMMDICNEYGDYEGGNWLYTDTDSVYYISTPEIEEAFERYNNTLCRDYYSYTSKGELTTMGEVTPDGCYTEFVQFGAKKYCKRDTSGHLCITVAGVPKKTGAKLLNNNIYNFRIGMVFDGERTGKLRPEYNYEPIHLTNVNGCDTLTASYQNLLPCDYVLSGIDDIDPDEILDNIIRNFKHLGSVERSLA